MILAEKIMTLRKRAGWSQEELAAQLGVSRQSVSKWEGAQSVPDMQKVVQMSRLFGVTTDYLLKEELGEPEPAQSEPDAPLRCVTMEQAADYLSLLADQLGASNARAAATLLCVLSPVALLLLAALSDRPGAALSENAAVGIGLCVLLMLVAAAVAVFITCAAQVKAYAFLETEPFETAYGVTGMVRERRAAAAPEHTRGKVAGTVLCILSAVPLFIAVCLNGPDLLYVAAVCLLLVFAGLGSALFVSGGDGPAARRGRLCPAAQAAKRCCWRNQQHLLAHGYGGVPALDVRSVVGCAAAGHMGPLGSRGCALRRSHGARARDPKMMCLQGNRKRKEPQGMPAALLQLCPCWCDAFKECTPGRMPDTTAVWTSMPVERRE